MRLKLITVLGLCLLLSSAFQQITFAQDSTPAKTIPFTSIGFNSELSPNGKMLVTYENIYLQNLKEVDPSLLPMHVIDITSGKYVGQLSGFSDYASGVAFTSDSRQLVSVHMNGDVNIWNVSTLKLVKTYQTLLIGNSSLSIFPDNRRILLMSGGIPQRFLVFDTQTGAITKVIGKHLDSLMEFQSQYTQFPGMGDIQFSSYALSADGKQLATATANDEVGIWQIDDNSYQQLAPAGKQYGSYAIRSMAFTKDGKTLVFSNTMDKKIHVWDVASKAEKATVDGVTDALGLSPDGKMLVWTSRGQDQPSTILVAPLDALDQAKVLLTLAKDYKFGPRMTSVRFTPDGKQVVVSGLFASNEAPNQIYVLDVPSS